MEIKLYTPHTHQKRVHAACNDETTFFITVNAGRQSGKTELSQQQALYWCLQDPEKKHTVYWVSPTAAQATKVYKAILERVIDTPFLRSYKGSMGDAEIVFSNGSIIKFRSAAQEDSLRGETIDYLVIDEGAFVKQSVFQEILLPMLNVRGKKCLIISTPKGKNFFFHQYMKGMQGNKIYKSFKFTSMDNPYSSPAIIEIAKENLPAVLFAQEYLGEFVDSAAIFENVLELATVKMSGKPVKGATYYAGIDIALKDDYSVFNVLNQDGEVVHYERYNHISAPDLKQKIKDCLSIWTPTMTYIEQNNQGLPILQDLQNDGVKCLQGFNTTSKSKPEIIHDLIAAFSSKSIRVPDDEVYKSELEIFTMTVSPTGSVKFAAPDGFHDDIPMSLAIAWRCMNENKNSGRYYFG